MHPTLLAEHSYWEESIIPANSAQTRYLGITDRNARLSVADIEAIKAAGQDIAVSGTIEYCDGFDVVRCLTFCGAHKPVPINDFTLSRIRSPRTRRSTQGALQCVL